MRNLTIIFSISLIFLLSSCKFTEKNPFWSDGEAFFDVQEVFSDERFPNVVIAKDGSVVTSWGSNNFRVRRSEDGGNSWQPEISIVEPGFQGGGAIVDEKSGDILQFVEEGHPVAPLIVYRSKDHGETWNREDITINPNSFDHIPSMHMNEHGITLQRGKYKGRLIRPTRYYGEGNESVFWEQHYTNAMYSDDGGKTWQTSEPFPYCGTGEAAIVELSDGTLYYNARRHQSTDGLDPRWRYVAYSYDGGHTWVDGSVSEELPDGLVRLPVDGYDILIFSNIDIPKQEDDLEFSARWTERVRGTVWASFDGGKTWPVKRLVDEGAFAYSSLAAGRAGTESEGMIYLLYESAKGAKMARFNLAWLTNGVYWKEYVDK